MSDRPCCAHRLRARVVSVALSVAAWWRELRAVSFDHAQEVAFGAKRSGKRGPGGGHDSIDIDGIWKSAETHLKAMGLNPDDVLSAAAEVLSKYHTKPYVMPDGPLDLTMKSESSGSGPCVLARRRRTRGVRR